MNSHDDNMNRPQDVVRDGPYKVSFWRNQGENNDYISAKPAKTYTDKDGNPRDTQNFTVKDLLPLSRLCEVAYDRGRELEKDIRQEQDHTPDRKNVEKTSYRAKRQTNEQARQPRQSRYIRGQ